MFGSFGEVRRTLPGAGLFMAKPVKAFTGRREK
jgi:hypothetical protein